MYTFLRNFLKTARSTPIGLPGGPCHILRNIEETPGLNPRLKAELIEDVEKGRDLDNNEANALYETQIIPLPGIESFKEVKLTAHALYRMDLRGVTISELKMAFEEVDKWFNRLRKIEPSKMKPLDREALLGLGKGEPLKFETKKIGLTVVFALDMRNRVVNLVSTWWTGIPNPPKPVEGECDIIPFLDSRTRFERPAILGSRPKAMINQERLVKAYLAKEGSVDTYQDIDLSSPEFQNFSADPVGWGTKFLAYLKKTLKIKGRFGKVDLWAPPWNAVLINIGEWGRFFIYMSPNGEVWPGKIEKQISLIDDSHGFIEVKSDQDLAKKVSEMLVFLPALIRTHEIINSLEKLMGLSLMPHSIIKASSDSRLVRVYINGRLPDGTVDFKIDGWVTGEKEGLSYQVHSAKIAENGLSYEALVDLIPEEFDDESLIFTDRKSLLKFKKDLSKALGNVVKAEVSGVLEKANSGRLGDIFFTTKHLGPNGEAYTLKGYIILGHDQHWILGQSGIKVHLPEDGVNPDIDPGLIQACANANFDKVSYKKLEKVKDGVKIYSYSVKTSENFSSISFTIDSLALLNSNLIEYLRSK
jgi:hypothetical protein